MALGSFTRKRFPIDWATNIQNRGSAKLERGRLEIGTEALYEALADFYLALEIRTPDRFPLGYAKSLGNMASTKAVLAERSKDNILALEAQLEIQEALRMLRGDTERFWRAHYQRQQAEIDALVQKLAGAPNA